MPSEVSEKGLTTSERKIKINSGCDALLQDIIGVLVIIPHFLDIKMHPLLSLIFYPVVSGDLSASEIGLFSSMPSTMPNADAS